MRINNKKEFDCQDFVKIYRECTKEPYNFLTKDTTLPASNLLRLEKIYLFLIKIAITDQIKILKRKIMQNEAQHDLDRKAAKVSALSSNN